MEFKNPYVLVLIPVVLGIFWLRYIRKPKSHYAFPSHDLVSQLPSSFKVRFAFIPFLLRMLALGLIIFAMSGPRVVLEESVLKTEGIDIVLSLDCSTSMAAEDFLIEGKRQSRFEIIKKVVGEFIQARPNDQIGLIGFAARAYTVCPLTTDRQWLTANLERMRLGMIEDGTAIGAGIASAVGRLKASQAKSKIIILLTDGVNNAGKIDPMTAAKTAQALGIKIYTIGAGVKGQAPYPMTDFFGRTFYQQVTVEIDEGILNDIAKATGGQYFRATDTESLRQVYKAIDKMEKTKIEQKGYKEYEELFWIFVLMGLSCLWLELVLSHTLFFRIP